MAYEIIQIVKDVVTGRTKFVNRAISKQRMDICNSCEIQSKFKTCTICGCFLPIKTKLEQSTCPMELW